MRIYTTMFAGLSLAASANGAVLVGPVVSPVNGHSYLLLTQNTWQNSEAEAVTLGGHLATVRSAEENAWIYEAFAPHFGGAEFQLWIGLNDAAQEGVFQWVSGEPLGYTNWAPGEPNNGFGINEEDFVHMVGTPFGGPPQPQQWNDARGDEIVAFGTYHGVVEIVPAPSTLGAAAAALFGVSRRRRTLHGA